LTQHEIVERELMRRGYRPPVSAVYPHLTGRPAGDWAQNATR
jgi:hypothetical protein